MSLRNRNGIWHYRFKFDGKEYAATTDFAATRRNESAALDMESEHRRALRDGKRGIKKIMVREFSDAAEDFLKWAKAEYRDHPNSEKRIRVSFTSLKEFFGKEPV